MERILTSHHGRRGLRSIVLLVVLFSSSVAFADYGIIIGSAQNMTDLYSSKVLPASNTYNNFDTMSVDYVPRELTSSWTLVSTHTSIWQDTGSAALGVNQTVAGCADPTKGGGTSKSLQMLHHFVTDSSLGGSQGLFKTDIEGVVFSIKFNQINADSRKIVFSMPNDGWLVPNNTAVEIPAAVTGSYNTSTCNYPKSSYSFYSLGGVNFTYSIYLYMNNKFNTYLSAHPGIRTLTLNLKTNSGSYPIEITDINHNGKTAYISLLGNTIPMTINYPTCGAPVVTQGGSSNSTVKFGNVADTDVRDNQVAGKRFAIEMKDCAWIKKINVKMTTTQKGSVNQNLLGNQTTGGAQGVGVEISAYQDAANTLKMPVPGTEMLVLPDTLYEYKYFVNNPDIDDNPSSKGSTTQKLEYIARLKADSTPTPGEFNAKATFTLDYP